MRQVFQIVGAAIAAVFALLLVSGLILPRHWKVESQIRIHAPPAQIHPHVEDLRAWEHWTTQHPDPTLRTSYSGPARGVGAERRYEGQRAGRGGTRITRSEERAGIWFESWVNSDVPNARGSITYEENLGSTLVTWSDEGALPFILGGFLRDSVQQGLRSHFERSLARLKDLAEGRTAPITDTAAPTNAAAPADAR